MRRRILPRILAVGILVLALAGCVRFQADLDLNPDDTVDGSIVVAVVLADETDESRATALTQASDIESQLLGSLRDAAGVSTSEYEQDGYLGSRITFDDVALVAFSGQRPESLKFTREGDQYVFTGVLDFSAQSIPSDEGEDDDGSNLAVSVTFPGDVTEHNGDLSGTTVSWSTPIDQRLEMSARGATAPPGAPVLVIVLVVGGILVLAAAVIAVLLLLRSRRAKIGVAPLATPDPAAPVASPELAAPVAPETETATETETEPTVTPDPGAPTPPVKKPRAPRTPPAESPRP